MPDLSQYDRQRVLYFHEQLRVWFAAHGRTFPWRWEADAYRVLVAERMLQRTQSKQVAPTYETFITNYPDTVSLARASAELVHNLLAPLGLLWRFESFIPMATQLVLQHGGHVPDDREALHGLPGVGNYTADAVLCFAFNHAVALVDTNTIRVAGRYLEGATWRGDARKRVAVRRTVASLLDTACPRASNYRLLDFAALVCTATKPHCSACPVSPACAYFQSRPSKVVPDYD